MTAQYLDMCTGPVLSLVFLSQSCGVFTSCDISTVTVLIRGSRELPCCFLLFGNLCLHSNRACIRPSPCATLSFDSHTAAARGHGPLHRKNLPRITSHTTRHAQHGHGTRTTISLLVDNILPALDLRVLSVRLNVSCASNCARSAGNVDGAAQRLDIVVRCGDFAAIARQ